MDDAWKLFVAEGVRMISESAAKFAGGPYMKVKWSDIANKKQEKEQKPGEIAASIIKGAGLTVVVK